ncbi:MAG TPA: hypothetical protein GXZ55_09045 [Natronincola sp.]|nr:hypothetical protein [Natronincola sp.]
MNSRRKLVFIVGLVLIMASASSALASSILNMEFEDAPLPNIFKVIGQSGGYNVLVDPSVSGEFSFVLKNMSVTEALDLVTRTTGYRYRLLGNTLIIGTEDRLKSEFGTEDVIFALVENVPVEKAAQMVDLMVPSVTTYVDEDVNLLVLFGLSTDLKFAQELLVQYDQKAFITPDPWAETTGGERLVMRFARVQYAGADMVDYAQALLPSRDFRYDAKTKNLSAMTTADEWKRVEQLILEKDFPDFVLKGLVSEVKPISALVEYEGKITIVKTGEFYHGWEVKEIKNTGVEFSQGERSFTVRIGR